MIALDRPDLPAQTLDQVTDGHTTWYGVGVHNQVRLHSLGSERHVLWSIGDTAGTFLPVPRGKLVTDLWDAHRPNPEYHVSWQIAQDALPDFDEFVSIVVEGQHDLVDNTCFRRPQEDGLILLFEPLHGTVR